MSKFDSLINNLLGEELSDRQKRSQALKGAEMLRTFTVEYQEYERHDPPPLQKFTVQGHTLWEALKQLPVHVFDDVITEWVEDLKELETNEEALKEYLDNIDFGGWPFFTVYEDKTFLCGIPPEEGGYEDEEGDYWNVDNIINRFLGEDLSDRQKRSQALRSAKLETRVIKLSHRVNGPDFDMPPGTVIQILPQESFTTDGKRLIHFRVLESPAEELVDEESNMFASDLSRHKKIFK